jgi:hypothetical protein
MGGYEGCAEGIEDGCAAFLLVELVGTDIGELVVGEGDVESRDKEVQSLSGGLLANGAKRGHLCLAVEGEP